MSLITVPRRVARGAAFLDRKAPGWERKIDLALLNIADTSACVCGQVFADLREGVTGYTFAKIEGFFDSDGARELGFNVDKDLSPPAHQLELSLLAETWINLVKERFNSGTLSDN